MKKILIILIIAAIYSCSKETELSDSIYLNDNENPGLPAYSEWGYNTFGAKLDRHIFRYSNSRVPLKIIKTGDEISFVFQGVNEDYSDLSLRFILKSPNIKNYKDLLIFNDTVINLSQDNVSVVLSSDSSKVLNILEGELFFKRAQSVYLDNEEYGIILSGYFDFKFIINEVPKNMSDGRFDFGINKRNFYVLSVKPQSPNSI